MVLGSKSGPEARNVPGHRGRATERETGERLVVRGWCPERRTASDHYEGHDRSRRAGPAAGYDQRATG
jgi:hypothetical protein